MRGVGGWVWVRDRSKVSMVMTFFRALRTLLASTHEPPSGGIWDGCWAASWEIAIPANFGVSACKP